jgi:y4mF family transcriptional regulator
VTITTPVQLGDRIRQQRKAQGLSQAALARRVPASQKWLSEVENGKATAEIGQILRLLAALGIAIELGAAAPDPAAPGQTARRRVPIPGKQPLLPGTAPAPPPPGPGPQLDAPPQPRFRRATKQAGDQTLREHAALIAQAFRRWGIT